MANFGSKPTFKVVNSSSTSVTNKSSVIGWLDSNIKVLEKRKNLEPVPHKAENGRMIAEIRAWSKVSDGKRVYLLKCRNQKVYQSEHDANNGISMSFSGSDYTSVLNELKDDRKHFASLEESNKIFKFWVRRRNEDKSYSVVQL